MKKIILSMMAAMVATASFAQNPDALKQVLKAEKKREATNIMKEQEGTMTGEERAKAYNHIVGMAIADNSKEQGKALTAKTDEEKVSYAECLTARLVQRGLLAVSLQPCVEVACHTIVGEGIGTVGCDVYLYEPVALQIVVFSSRGAYLCVFRQYDDT